MHPCQFHDLILIQQCQSHFALHSAQLLHLSSSSSFPSSSTMTINKSARVWGVSWSSTQSHSFPLLCSSVTSTRKCVFSFYNSYSTPSPSF